MEQFNLIVFIDDDNATNVYHKIITDQAEVTKNYKFFIYASKALTYLKRLQKNNKQPDLIFLDINMPGINGWEFVDLYAKLRLKKYPPIVVLTTSYRNTDVERCEANPIIYSLRSKPLDIEYLFYLKANLNFQNKK